MKPYPFHIPLNKDYGDLPDHEPRAKAMALDDNLLKIPAFINLSHATHALLIQNIAIALGIKAVFLVLTLIGLSTMWMAVFADMGASLLVVGNGLRLLRK